MTNSPSSVPDSPSERDFYRHWLAATAGSGDEVLLALTGGEIADRLAWVFMSGYQAAVQRCFPEFAGAGWACFAVAEPKDSPGCSLLQEGDGFRLTGSKSWIAGADTVERLVCSVGADADRRFVLVRADAPGVSLTNPRVPTFLKQLSQGAARFDDTRIAAGAVLTEPGRAQWFRGAEPLFVLLALNACLRRQAAILENTALEQLAGEAVAFGRTLSADLGDKSRIVPGLRTLREATSAVIGVGSRLVDRFPAPLRESWEADELFFGMFGISGGTGSSAS